MATKASTSKRAPEGMDRIRAAVAAVAAKGKEPSLRTVRAELTRNGRPGASFTYIVAVLKEWRAQTLHRVSGRVENAVVALLALETDLERDAVKAAVRTRTAGGVRVQFTVAARWKGGGHTGNVRQRAAKPEGDDHAPR
jgi:nitric oxide reductase activation protein